MYINISLDHILILKFRFEVFGGKQDSMYSYTLFQNNLDQMVYHRKAHH